MIRRFLYTALIGIMAGGCTMTPLNAPFTVPQGFLVTAVSAPLSVKMHNISLSDDLIREEQSFSFFWLPLMTPSIAVSDRVRHSERETYTDYDYFSFLGGIFSSVTLRRYGK